MAKKSKGLNIERVEKLLEKVEDVKEEVVQVDDEKLTKEDINELKEEINETTNQEKEINEMNKLVLNREIRKAIKAGETSKTRGLNGKQYKAIQESYTQALGEPLSENQLTYIKTLNETQGRFVISTINQYKRYMRNQEMLATSTN